MVWILEMKLVCLIKMVSYQMIAVMIILKYLLVQLFMVEIRQQLLVLVQLIIVTLKTDISYLDG